MSANYITKGLFANKNKFIKQQDNNCDKVQSSLKYQPIWYVLQKPGDWVGVWQPPHGNYVLDKLSRETY